MKYKKYEDTCSYEREENVIIKSLWYTGGDYVFVPVRMPPPPPLAPPFVHAITF